MMTFVAMTILDLIVLGAVFVLVLSLWIGGVLLWSMRRSAQRRKVEHRLGIVDERAGPSRVLHLWHLDGEASAVVPGVQGRTIHQRLQQTFRDAGFRASVGVVLSTLVVVMILVTGMLYVLFGNLVLAAAGAATAALFFRMYVSHRIAKRTALFERQFVDAMELASRSLRAGHPLMGAFRLVSEELSPPVNEIFLEVCQHHDMGVSVEEALRQAAADLPTGDMRLFATCVAIQARSGGNLADMMERLAAVVRDRMRIARRIRVLTAQTQLSKRILVGLPVVMFIFLNLIAREYMSTFYTTPAGNVLLGIGIAGLLLGAWSMNRIATLRY
jgi:tight adherence protein B